MIQFLSRLSLISLFALAISFAAAEDKKETPKLEMTRDERILMELVNKERVKAKLPALQPNPLLFKAARGHSAKMAKQQKMEHVLDGKRPAQRVEEAGYNWGKVRENILTADMPDVPADKIVKAWMDSKVHRDNILADDVTETGLGIARNAKGEAYYTQVFARERKVKSQN